MEIKAKDVTPEVIAVISAAVQQMVGSGAVAVSIKRADNWTLSGRRSIL